MKNWHKKDAEDGISFDIRIIPNARKNEGMSGALIPMVGIHRSAVEGAANKGLKQYLGKVFNISSSQISIVKESEEE